MDNIYIIVYKFAIIPEVRFWHKIDESIELACNLAKALQLR